MNYEFSAYGHPNITARHRTTLEFTKDREATANGDCIVGVKADFELPELKKFLSCGRIRIGISVAGMTEEITATPNPGFSSSHEMVIRKTEFASARTFAVRADKSSCEISRSMAAALKAEEAEIRVNVTAY
ncbi:DUF371 domain-containing protein [Candidatus Woesearchaeota archaeon]|nr:DUF371 domain-containing protein [Candidatus Woesearchaeota archaeon]